MAAEKTSHELSEAYPMKGGDGPNSYAKNSLFQRGIVDATKQVLTKEIEEKLDLEILSSSKPLNMVDLGCSVGPNSFVSVDNILEAVQLKYQSQGLNNSHKIFPEFQVFFNDHTQNDFNLLFKSLPPNRQYYAAGVPGSFYARLFPNDFIHIFHSSFALHWLSRVPKEVTVENSPAWNKGQVDYSNSSDEVVRAYEAQYAEDMECFLNSRAQEIVHGGLMLLIAVGRPNGTLHSKTLASITFQVLGSCLMDLVRKGVISEEQVDSFNVPIYYASPQELEASVERNGCFTIERMANLPRVVIPGNVSKPRLFTSHQRAAMEVLIRNQFGEEILDELFDLYCKKLEMQPSIFESGKAISFIVVLKRKV